MGTSLSGLTPATTFDGLLKTSDNDAIGTGLKTIGTGDGTDSVLQLSDSALQVNGDLNVGSVHQVYQDLNDLIIKGNSGATYLKYYTNSGSNLTNQFGIGNFFRYSVGVGFTGAQSAAMLNIKGSGATSATTSLLVQNSAGTNLLQANDDGVVLIGPENIYKNHRLELKGDGSNGELLLRLQSNFNGSGGYTGVAFTNSTNGGGVSSSIRAYRESDHYALALNFGSNAGTDVLRAKSTGEIGIGETTPTARLHVKGSGNDNTTTSLLVQNSDAADMLKILDDRSIETYDATGNIIAKNNAGNRRFEINPDLNTLVDFQVGGGGLSNLIRTDSGLNSVGIGTGGLASTRLVVKGSGATSATTALLVQNSAGSELFKLTDDGTINLGVPGDNPTIQSGSNAGKSLTLGSTATLSALNINLSTYDGINYSPVLSVTGNTDQFVGIGESTPTARLQVKGSGNDNTTTALLVQNSDGDELLKVSDDGVTKIKSDATAVPLYVNATGGTTGIEVQVQGNRRFRILSNNSLATLETNQSGGITTNGSLNVGGNAAADAGVRLQVKGSGATSATTALLVENSAGTDLFKVQDNGNATFSGNTSSQRFYTNLGFYHSGATNNVLLPNITTGWVLQTANATGNVQVKNINVTASKETSASLQVDSTTQGFLPPRMTTTERDAISSPASGLMVYNTTTNKAQCYNGTAWQDLF